MPGYTLGLDIGVTSIGWAIVSNGVVERCGVHLFDAGVADAHHFDQGKDMPRAAARRQARAARRLIWRRAERKRNLLRALIRGGLLPEGDVTTPAAIDRYVKSLDGKLVPKWCKSGNHLDQQTVFYRMRAEAAVRRVELLELGRCLYHLAQRRGFLSNRKVDRSSSDDELGVVKSSIKTLQDRIDAHPVATLGALLASIDVVDERLRGRWTARSMYAHEFAVIWAQQTAHHPALSESLRQALHRAIFHQRPLKGSSHLVGKCELIPSKRRAPIAARVFQTFRVLSVINNLRLSLPNGDEIPLADEQRSVLREHLLREPELSFAAGRKLLGRLPPRSKFNLEAGGEKRIIGHRTDSTLRSLFGDRFETLTDEDREAVVADLRSIVDPDACRRRAREHWSLDDAAAERFVNTELEDGYASLSLTAIARLLPHLERELTYAEARKIEFPASFESKPATDELPPLDPPRHGGKRGRVNRPLSNVPTPAVLRALSELRTVVNAIIRRFGKPERVHVELARDLKKGRKRREEIWKRMRAREKDRKRALAAIVADGGLGTRQPKPVDIDKYLLAEECGWTCPYTGTSFGLHDLLGESSKLDIEHIWPFSRSLDNSWMNKTLCIHEENRGRKRGATPYEAYSGTPERYKQICQRVRAFKTDPYIRSEKLRRFEADAIDADEFLNRHLTETRQISRAASEYLGLLYGGPIDSDGRRRVQVSAGGATAWLRREWGLDRVLGPRHEPEGDGPEPASIGKNRADHRHHAVDAIVIAMTDAAAVKRLAAAAETSERLGSFKLFSGVEPPAPGFLDQIRARVDEIVVSHRQSRKVRGKLHGDTLYSKPHAERRRIRKELRKLTIGDVTGDAIVDIRAREAIRRKLADLGGIEPAKAFADPTNLPMVAGADGREVRLRKVRLAVDVHPKSVGRGERERFVASTQGSNHHTVIYARLDANGRETRWFDRPASLLEVYERKRLGQPIVDRTVPDGCVFKFSLAANEYIELDLPRGEGRGIFRVLNISDGDIEVRQDRDGRTGDEIKRSPGERAALRLSGAKVLKRRARKVFVNHLGQVANAGG
jgi:CRISPR-associated endonuclease Csn1